MVAKWLFLFIFTAEIIHFSKVGKCILLYCLVDCNWSQWSKWSECSRTCGEGQQKRSRTPDSPPKKNGGADCKGFTDEIRDCKNNSPCRKFLN